MLTLAEQHRQVFGGASAPACIDHTMLPGPSCASYRRSPNVRPVAPLASSRAPLHSGCGSASGEYACVRMFSQRVLIVSVQDNLKELAVA